MLERIPYIEKEVYIDRDKVSYISSFKPRWGDEIEYYTTWQDFLKVIGFNPKPEMMKTYGSWSQAYVTIDGHTHSISLEDDELAEKIYDWFLEKVQK